MDKNHSPWLSEINKERQPHALNASQVYEVAIIGGGIAGMATAYYALKHTNKSVVLIEANRIAHGATGHNAGQVVDYFEKPFSEIVEEYGLKMAVEGQRAVSGAWNLVEDILKEAHIHIPFVRFMGYAGCTHLNQVLVHLENKYQKQTGGIHVESVELAEEIIQKKDIPAKYHDLCDFVPQSKILKQLETPHAQYIATLHSRKGTMNSALFVEKLSEYLLKEFPSRFAIREHAPVSEVHLYPEHITLDTKDHGMHVQYAVLCTNGFENITLTNHTGLDINPLFHNNVKGVIGYMAGYLETKILPPKAISYFAPSEIVNAQDPYFYVTRRNHMWEDIEKSLVCVGGPEEIHEEVRDYSTSFPYSKIAFESIDTFLRSTYPDSCNQGVNYIFKWHGLMGYTQSGIRSIGPEPANPRLLYNLGCNGVGILPSIYGGKKIADHLAGSDVPASIFDPIIQKTVLMQKG